MKRVVMEVLYPCVAGLDVHQASVVACRRRLLADGHQVESEVGKFGSTTRELQRLAAWLQQWGVTQVAMESTGVYWIPVWNILCEQFQLVLCNAQHLKKVPGRKTDVTDAEWIAQLMQCGLLRGSFVPAQHVREWRDLTRQRTKLLDQHTAVVNRLHKTLEQGNIKLSSVTSDLMGVSGRLMVKALSAGEEDAERLADLARGRLKAKRAELVASLEGRLSEHQRWTLRRLWGQMEFLEGEVAAYDERLEELLRPFASALERLDSIAGVGRRTAQVLLAELGPEMRQFPDADHCASWAGMSPGNQESGGKRQSGRRPGGNKWLRRALTGAAYAGARCKESYLAAQYRRLAVRRGKKRAAVAVGRTILIAAYYILRDEKEYEDLGGDYFVRRDSERLKQRYVRGLKELGYGVELHEMAAAA